MQDLKMDAIVEIYHRDELERSAAPMCGLVLHNVLWIKQSFRRYEACFYIETRLVIRDTTRTYEA